MRRIVLLATVLAGLLLVPLAGASTNLRGADLRGADLRGKDLRGADLRGADLRGARLDGADLRGANLSGARLNGASLRRARVNGLPSPASCAPNCAGANLTWGYVASGADFSNVDFSGAQLRYFNGDNANFSGANFNGANLSTSSFTSANLAGANFTYANLTNAILQYSNMTNVVANNAVFISAQLEGATTLGWQTYGASWGSGDDDTLAQCTSGDQAGPSGCPAAQGFPPSSAATVPYLIDPSFAVTSARVRPGRAFRVRMSKDWPVRKAPCRTAGSGSILFTLAQRGRIYVFPLQRLGKRRMALRMPSRNLLRRAGIRPTGRATLTATVLGCATRATFFGRDTVRF